MILCYGSPTKKKKLTYRLIGRGERGGSSIPWHSLQAGVLEGGHLSAADYFLIRPNPALIFPIVTYLCVEP